MQTKDYIAILGAGESGCGAALLAQSQGYEVFVSDRAPIAPERKQELSQKGIGFEEKQHSEEKIFSASTVVKSPGIPEEVALVQKLRQRGVPVISEIEWASRFTHKPMIAITGTNGKTTTTRLTHYLMDAAGKNVSIAGNIGPSFARKVSQENPDWWVVEVSSFQLDGTLSFRPQIGMILNITPDHLDRYENQFENYAASKFRMVRNMDTGTTFIANFDNPTVYAGVQSRDLRCTVLGFGSDRREGLAAYRADQELVCEKPQTFRIPLDQLPMPGEHNLQNTMAAVLACLSAGCEPQRLLEALPHYANDPHRLEKVAVRDGVTYINDSKATNVDAVAFALEAFHQPLIWIGGGVDKGNDYAQIAAAVSERVKGIVALGLDNHKMEQAFAQQKPFKEARTMQEAVAEAAAMATPGDVVLLSPACASFDLFKNYEDRGNQFKKAVNSL